jgi:endonuclease-3
VAAQKTSKPSKTAAKPARAPRRARPSSSATELLAALREAHPDAHCELDHATPFQLLVATVLSAQTTDVAVNKATPALFAAYPTAETLAKASPEAVEEKISTIGMFRQKARNVTKLAKMLVERHGGEVPRTLAELVELPGVGRKTANVVLGVAFGAPEGVVVDTHVQRLSQRLGFTKETEPERIEKALCELLPRDVWDITSHTLIFHGRRVCFARKPACATCSVSALCPSAFEAEEVGRKPKRARGTPEPPAPASKARATPKKGTPTTKAGASGRGSGTKAKGPRAAAKKR